MRHSEIQGPETTGPLFNLELKGARAHHAVNVNKTREEGILVRGGLGTREEALKVAEEWMNEGTYFKNCEPTIKAEDLIVEIDEGEQYRLSSNPRLPMVHGSGINRNGMPDFLHE